MSRHFLIALVMVASAAGVRSQTPLPASVDAIVAAAARYVGTGAEGVTAFVMDEVYTQEAAPAQWLFSLPRTVDPPVRRAETRKIESALFVAWDPERGLTEWRDVSEVDGRKVAADSDSMGALARGDWPLLRARAGRMAAAASHYDLNPEQIRLDRTANLPMAYATVLQRGTASGLTFSLDGVRTVHGAAGQVLRFRSPFRIRTGRASTAPATEGSFVIDPATGAALATNIALTATRAGAVVRGQWHVTFSPQPGSPIWVPEAMTEHYDILNADGAVMGTIDGRATYSHLRLFRTNGEDVGPGL